MMNIQKNIEESKAQGKLNKAGVCNISFSSKYVEKLIEDNDFKLFYEGGEEDLAILVGDTPVGLIEFYGSKGGEIEVFNIEIMEKYRRLGYASKVIAKLQETFEASVVGYCRPEDDAYEFWCNMGAEFENCEDCENHQECDGFGCDKPLDYCFKIRI